MPVSTVCAQHRLKLCGSSWTVLLPHVLSPGLRQITEWMGRIEKAQTSLWVTLWECDEPAKWLLLCTQPHIHVRAHTHTLTISERHKHLDVRYVSFKIKVLTRTKFWTYVLNITDERVQFGVAPVSQIQKAGLYSLTADTDTWSWMYRPDENRWTETDEQHMYRLFFLFHIDTL